MSNIHTLFDSKSKWKYETNSSLEKEEETKATTTWNGNGVQAQERDALGLNELVNKSKQGGQAKPGQKSAAAFKITLYQNGFTIDDGEFRDY